MGFSNVQLSNRGAGAGTAGAAPAPPLVSKWFGGPGGDECELACASANLTDGWRNGGVLQSVVVGGGERVDSLALARCSADLEV